ncbi:lysophospholipid acyltransferase family protein [Parapusillimonas granuli]|uniref:1-acyl-sn-glycerol-3-phosphate acyltransferase n=1 Tax=Parapusillimonas granuli TaxID=380911 RepID=A0A853FYC2_9BURK|nr:1-acyl-sn-glycerol-3-phosphate acyltransferase [Parapusillimonas granuli]MBB5215821.1 1-acyl-sn-glycerol-3-phosphate acyltransferase [Parapusillimonas granuli]MEB2399488.1 1-acyl-sn-glycerol-3-phosphate acyltransferase [Alcaligenaceae bacterium]NYT51114.1 1-acyl-sn-glycerol-3-phosphate acyltransferase [Parapusillimonas granuli]
MNILRFLLRAAFVATWIVLGLLSVTLIFPFAPLRMRSYMVLHWSRGLMLLCGVGIRVYGSARRAGPVMLVANHVSWIDIFVLNAVRPTAFIAKSDIRRWPVIGWLVEGAGTVFIERGRRHAIRAVGHQMKTRFSQGEAVGLFPEGTTSPGYEVAPFHSSLFDAAIRANVDIQPVALRFFHRGRRSDYVAFVGEQNLMQNLWYLLGTTGVVVEAVFLPELRNGYCQEQGRARVAEQARAAIIEAISAFEA